MRSRRRLSGGDSRRYKPESELVQVETSNGWKGVSPSYEPVKGRFWYERGKLWAGDKN